MPTNTFVNVNGLRFRLVDASQSQVSAFIEACNYLSLAPIGKSILSEASMLGVAIAFSPKEPDEYMPAKGLDYK